MQLTWLIGNGIRYKVVGNGKFMIINYANNNKWVKHFDEISTILFQVENQQVSHNALKFGVSFSIFTMSVKACFR